MDSHTTGRPSGVWAPLIRVLLCLGAACILALAAGCSVGAPAVEPEAASAGPTFRLGRPVGQERAQQVRDAGEATVANCEGDRPLVEAFSAPYDGPGDLLLESDGVDETLAPWRGVMAAAAREAYRLADAYPPTLAETVALEAPAGMTQVYRLAWEETWEENVVEVVEDGATVAEVPLRILISAALGAEPAGTIACDARLSQEADRATVILETSRPLETTPPPTPGASAGACEPPLAVSAAQQRVERYVALLQARDYAGAFGMLDESYRLRVPLPQYEAGYRPVQEIALCSLETVGEIGAAREMVHATLRLTLDVGGGPEQSVWVARYEVLRSGAIASVEMYPATLGEE